MKKIIEINTCAVCPNKIWAGNGRVCCANGYKTINVPITDIPDWCPLPDAPNQPLDSDTKSSGDLE